MPVNGPLSHIDLTISEPRLSIPFYVALFDALGYRRLESSEPGFAEPDPERAAWFLQYASGALFGIEIRPARPESRDKSHDRYAPGLHHLAFHAESREQVDRVYRAMQAMGATVLDPPSDYSGRRGYGPGYYAVFFADPDGLKLEVVHEPARTPEARNVAQGASFSNSSR